MSPEESHGQLIAGRELRFRLRFSQRRSIGFRVDAQGLLVTAPLGLPRALITEALAARAAWIFKHLDALPAPLMHTPLAHGALVQVLGEPHQLLLHAGRRPATRAAGRLELGVAAGVVPAQALERWFRREAQHYYPLRVQHFAERLGVAPPLVRLTSARTRWGSCNHRGEIRLHWRLMQAPPTLIDYVVAHELAHLLELNHSPRFWAHVERVFPHWRESRAQLRAQGAALWSW